MSSNPPAMETPLTACSSAQSKPLLSYPKPDADFQEIVRNPQLFWEKLQSLHNSLGAKYLVPTVAGKSLDLHRLFVEVTLRGGIEKVIRERRWDEVIGALTFPSHVTSASFILRKFYLSMLYHFEQVYYLRKEEPSSVPDPTNKTFSAIETGHPINADALINELSGTPSLVVGNSVTGTIDAKFDYGYVISVNMGSEILNGTLYHKPMQPHSPQSTSASTVPTKQNRKKHQQLALVDPSRPRQNLSGYNFFFAEQYARLKPAHHGHVRAISKEIGMLWSRLTDAEKQVYQEKGMRDKERYRNEMLEYKSSQPVQTQ